jgi:FtsH-binding integral membrane protein
MASETVKQGDTSQSDDQSGDMERKMYLRFAAMIVTSMFVMYWVMFVASWDWSHIRFSQSRVYMTLVMGGTMTLIMLGWMLNMYKNTKVNIGIVVVGLLLIGAGTFLDRSQVTVGDV